ncbi:MAG: hypothetical protein J6T63_08005 [Bacteroidales bacterium]|nr:hypothetical protein [Bacteroidales bacterium]
MITRFSKVLYILSFAIALMFSLASCHKEPIVLYPLTTLNIELTQKSGAENITSKIYVLEIDAVVSLAYEDDTTHFNCHFCTSNSNSEFYMYDYAHSDIVYAMLHKPFKIIVDARFHYDDYYDSDASNYYLHGESDALYVVEDEPIAVLIELGNPEVQENFIDLGLPSGLLWAKSNLGAESPEDYGNYYAWAETYPKHILNRPYNWEFYKYYSNNSGITKYTSSDGLVELEASDDIVFINYLSVYTRTPSRTDFDELLNYCTKTWTTRNGVNGYEFVGPNGNSIFLPASGGYSNESLLNNGSCGFYWLNSVYSDENYAYGFLLDSTTVTETSYYRMYGQTIRPVYNGQ